MRIVGIVKTLCKWCHKVAMPGQDECWTCRNERIEREDPDEGRNHRS